MIFVTSKDGNFLKDLFFSLKFFNPTDFYLTLGVFKIGPLCFSTVHLMFQLLEFKPLNFKYLFSKNITILKVCKLWSKPPWFIMQSFKASFSCMAKWCMSQDHVQDLGFRLKSSFSFRYLAIEREICAYFNGMSNSCSVMITFCINKNLSLMF